MIWVSHHSLVDKSTSVSTSQPRIQKHLSKMLGNCQDGVCDKHEDQGDIGVWTPCREQPYARRILFRSRCKTSRSSWMTALVIISSAYGKKNLQILEHYYWSGGKHWTPEDLSIFGSSRVNRVYPWVQLRTGQPPDWTTVILISFWIQGCFNHSN